MQALVDSGQLQEPTFAFYLGHDEQGELMLGGVDPERFVGNLTYINVTNPGYWAVPLDFIRLGDFLTMNLTATAIIDSGTSLLVGPEREVEAIAALLGARLFNGLYLVRCNELPNITFALDGHDFPLAGAELVIQGFRSFCVLGLKSMRMRKPMWILGDVFMRKYYVQFDWNQRRMGFALASHRNDHNTTNLI